MSMWGMVGGNASSLVVEGCLCDSNHVRVVSQRGGVWR